MHSRISQYIFLLKSIVFIKVILALDKIKQNYFAMIFHECSLAELPRSSTLRAGQVKLSVWRLPSAIYYALTRIKNSVNAVSENILREHPDLEKEHPVL